MSLTSFLKDNADVRKRFAQEFKKPEFLATKALVAPSLTKHPPTVGTAFDYLLRFLVNRLNRRAIAGCWVAEEAVDHLADDPALHAKGKKIVSRAKKHFADYLKTGHMCEALMKSALLLATLDAIWRSPRGREKIGVVLENGVQDLKNLVAAFDQTLFTAKRLCLLNPSFGRASSLVGGADADLVVDDTIIDVKTTTDLSLKTEAFHQVLGYYVLHHIGGVGGLNPKPTITKVAIYFSRHGYLHVMQLSEVIDSKTFPEFVRWFQGRSAEKFQSVAE